MVSCALLYNFTGKKAEMTKMVCMMMNIRFKSVGQEDYHQPLGALLTVPGAGLIYTKNCARSAMLLNRWKKKNAGKNNRPKIKNNGVKSKNP